MLGSRVSEEDTEVAEDLCHGKQEKLGFPVGSIFEAGGSGRQEVTPGREKKGVICTLQIENFSQNFTFELELREKRIQPKPPPSSPCCALCVHVLRPRRQAQGLVSLGLTQRLAQ